MTERAPSIFLWPPDESRPDPDAYIPPSGEWWGQYVATFRKAVERGQISGQAVEELTLSSRRIVGLLPNPKNWDRPSPWKGLVVGSVQSGKTQSMMGVAAVALDAGYRLVIVLAGMKDDLRTQTARRFNTQLLRQNDEVKGARGASTLGGPIGAQGNARAFAPTYFRDCTDDQSLAIGVPRALDTKPVVLVIKKKETSLAFAKTILARVYARHGVEKVPTLILDDECDEASVPGGQNEEKAVPEAITSLWDSMPVLPRVAYVGYTATAAANLLQDSAWPLYPNFVWLLRSPGPASTDLEYLEPYADSWYTGGSTFYEAFGDEPAEDSNFLIRATITDEDLTGQPEENASLADALRAFLVGGAYRLELQPGTSLIDESPRPDPHSLMIHTSAAQDDHAVWLNGIVRKYGRKAHADGVIGLDPATLTAMLCADEAAWRAWYDRFNAARERIHDTRPHQTQYRHVAWGQVKGRLPEVFEATRIKVVNSNAGESLDYEPSIGPDGKLQPPRDVYVIAIGGSRLSRGITVKGLGISYFTRWANQRFEDTLLQMSRWFGYRGPYLEFCRVFLTREAYQGFKEMQQNDLRLRRRLAQMMRERQTPGHATHVFRASPDVRPTAKLGVGKVSDLAFSPFSHVFSDVRYGGQSAANLRWAEELVREIKKNNCETARTDNGKPRGYLSRDWPARKVADLLDALAYEGHNPADNEALHEGRFRKPDPTRPVRQGLEPRRDPYHLAAYLRYWADHQLRDAPAPSFNVAVSFGSKDDESGRFEFPLLDRAITRDGRVEGAWTGRSSGWPGDYYFDRLPEAQRLGPTERAHGSPALLVLYIVHKDATGTTEKGIAPGIHTPFIGVNIPDGGPLFTRVVKEGKSS